MRHRLGANFDCVFVAMQIQSGFQADKDEQ